MPPAEPTDQYSEEVARILTMMSAMAGPRPVTADLIETWASVLWEQGMPLDKLQPTARRLLATERFFPPPADFLAAWENLKAEARANYRPTPEQQARNDEAHRRKTQELLARLPQLQAEAAERAAKQDRYRSDWLEKRAAEEARDLIDPFGEDAPRC